MKKTSGYPILLFDGVCNLCNGAVQFIIQRDPNAVFYFASLQSDYAKKLLTEYKEKSADLSTVVLLENGKLHVKSDAALRAVRYLSGLWPLLYGFIILPRPLRNAVYDWVARNRYRWFGKKNQCMIPRPEWRERFLG